MEVGGLFLDWCFDSGNLSRAAVRRLPPTSAASSSSKTSSSGSEVSVSVPVLKRDPDNNNISLWLKSDCEGKSCLRNYRTWFYFCVSQWTPGSVARFRIENMNNQKRLFLLGHSPVVKVGDLGNWETLPVENLHFKTLRQMFKLEFWYKFPSGESPVTDRKVYFALTYPYTFSDHQSDMKDKDLRFSQCLEVDSKPKNDQEPYYHRQSIARSLENRSIDILTISSYEGISELEENQPQFLSEPRSDSKCQQQGRDESMMMSSPPKLFPSKPVIFLSARVHPGESGSSHVMRGVISFLLNSQSKEAAELRKRFVFKLVPMLNPDGVFHGHYRCDTKGVNLNRVFNRPNPNLHPSIYAVKELLLWYQDKKHLCVGGPVRRSPKYPQISSPPTSDSFMAGKRAFGTPPPLMRRNSDSSSSPSKQGYPGVRKARKPSGFQSSNSKRTPPGGYLPSASLCRPTASSSMKIRRNLYGNCGQQNLKSATGKRKGGVQFYVDFHGHVSKGIIHILRNTKWDISIHNVNSVMLIEPPPFKKAEIKNYTSNHS